MKNASEIKLTEKLTRTPRTILASLAAAMLGTSLFIGPAPASAATSVDEPAAQLFQGTITCGENEDLAIFQNVTPGMQRVVLSYKHGCSKGWLSPVMKTEDGTTTYIPGCPILKKGVGGTEGSCTVNLPIGAAIYMVQSEDYKESTGSGHSWEVQAA